MSLLAYPLSLDAFFAGLLIEEIRFDAPPQLEINQTAGGEQLSAQIGPQLFTGTVTLGTMTRAEASTPDVLLDALGRPGASFLAYDTRRPNPLADPTGAILGATVPVISALIAGNREISLSGLPPGYVLSRGDYLAWSYDGGRRALHRVLEPVTASAGGVAASFEVSPALRPGSAVGAQVTLRRAACIAKLQTGSVQKGASRRTITTGMSFGFIQTLRPPA